MRKWVTVEIEVCEFCGCEDCYGECQRPIVPREPPYRVEHFKAPDPVTGVEMDYRMEFRENDVTVIAGLVPAQSPNLAE